MIPASLRSVIIGTTGLCNASCIHCPTGKPETAHLPKRVMRLDLFENIVRQTAENELSVQGNLSLGLFGDGLLDPFVVQRCEIVRRWLPHAPLAINTNGAAYDRAKHLPLVDLVRSISLHVESLRPEIYNLIMQPLRFERVFPNIQSMLQDFGRIATPGTPLHRLNIGERDSLLAFFKDAGAREVHFAAISNPLFKIDRIRCHVVCARHGTLPVGNRQRLDSRLGWSA
jgi:MoaA/NifB/PqqE/SkfB family radical SAM enzyme